MGEESLFEFGGGVMRMQTPWHRVYTCQTTSQTLASFLQPLTKKGDSWGWREGAAHFLWTALGQGSQDGEVGK